MSVGGKGPVPRQPWRLNSTPTCGHGHSFTENAVSLIIFRHFGNPSIDEVYLHGESLIGVVETYVGFVRGFERQMFVRGFAEMAVAGRLQSRGPHAWAISYSSTGRGFTTVPGVLPPRQGILDRDKWKCRYCGASLLDRSPHIDHVFPKSRGGWDDAANVVAACGSCNSSKGPRTPEEWGAADPSAPWRLA